MIYWIKWQTRGEQQENPEVKVDVSGIQLTDLGDFDDLENARTRQEDCLEKIIHSRE